MGIWIDTDMGVDDLFAVLMLDRTLPIDGMSLVFGCAELATVRANALDAAVAYGWTFPVTEGADRALCGTVETAARILGPSGQPSRGLRLPRAVDRSLTRALTGLAAWLERREAAQILALGPLTNLANLALARPDLLPRIGRIVWMGGSVGRGNHTPYAEFNAIADPEALALLLAREVPMVMVDLEACRKVQVTEPDLAPLPPILHDLMGGYLDIGLSRGRPGMALYDPVAAALLRAPELFTLSPVELTTELADPERRGQTRVAPATGTPWQIVSDLDAEAVRDLCLSALRDPS
ncbi:nucleoside hydrolase [Salipiger sp. P9]|uniref:nucleoside hydrolase n=1 Tax=Salipiger pentaromativorans TaxID=2943193 RepID=UPI0021577CBA|nr:nucleoside hydrolase [Salipiger pentaromativorans]MCR8550989.1 nucleoside hydrolase [Salipiger pentaromativorans]